MGQAGSQPAPAPPQRARRAHTLPHEPPRHAPKVLPSLPESPRLRSTDNGAILQSGGTISGRRPGSHQHDGARVPHGHVHANMYRSRSAGAAGDAGELRARERDPLHRSHTNLDLRNNDNSSLNKRFGSEPDLRIEEEQQKPKCNNKHFRKKYRAPQPPTSNEVIEGSSPDSSEGNARLEPQRKLRLFKTRNETKKINGPLDSKLPVYRYKNNNTEYRSLDYNDNQAFERRYRSPCKDKEQHFKYPDSKDMVQTSASLKREERIIQTKQDYKKTRIDRVSGCRAKTSKTNEHSEAWKTPLLNRNFRYSERFRREDSEQPSLRREKTFDNTLIINEKENASPRAIHEDKIKALGEQLRSSQISPLADISKPLRKSLPSLLLKNNEEKDEFQAELKKATSRIRNELGSKVNVSQNKTSQNDKTSAQKPNPTKSTVQSKVKESSLKANNISKQETKNNVNVKQDTKAVINNRRPVNRSNETKTKVSAPQANVTTKVNNAASKYKYNSKESSRSIPDRGQASGKESTPEHSPTRKKESTPNLTPSDVQSKPIPSKQFYFGMIESKQTLKRDHLKDFPGLGSPIIEEISNFHLIEKKLLGYNERTDEDAEFKKFNDKLKEDCKIKNLSSESALSSDGSEGEGSDGSLGIALRLRPTLPKKQPSMPRFSPAAAWRQLASLDAHLALETQPLAVETKMSADISAESSPRSEQSVDKSGDSGISGDHAHSDNRVDSPSRHNTQESSPAAWTPQQDLGDSSSDGAGPPPGAAALAGRLATYSPGAQPFSLSLPRDQDREPEQNWFLTKSAPNSLSNPLLFQRKAVEDDIIKEEFPPSDKEESGAWRGAAPYLSWGGHVMYLPPAPAAPAAPAQPLSMLGPIDRPVRSKSSGCLEAAARAARAALASEMRERERSASPELARALPARVEPAHSRNQSNLPTRGKRFTFQSTVRQLERRRLAEKLSREADLKEQQRRTELEAMRRVEEEFQRKRAREKASIRQQLRLVSSGAASMPAGTHHAKTRDEPDGSCRDSPAPERTRERKQGHSNASSEISGRSKSTTPIRCVELSEWRTDSEARVYRDWAAGLSAHAHAHAHPAACARMPMSAHVVYNAAAEGEAFSGSPRSDNYRLEFARGRSPRTPRPPRLLAAARSPSTSGSELSLRQPIKIRW